MRKSFRPKHLELRFNTYFAVLYIPKDVQHFLGKKKFYQTTGTGDLRIAEVKAANLVLVWKRKIASARYTSKDPIIASAVDLQKHLKRKDSSAATADEIIEDEEYRIRQESGDFMADTFHDIARGNYEPLERIAVDWIAHEKARGLKQKTIDQMNTDVSILLGYFVVANHFIEERVNKWIRYIVREGNLTPSSINRVLGSCRNFVRYLEKIKESPKDSHKLFDVPDEYKISKKPNSKSRNKAQSWLVFKQTDVVKLHNEALKLNDYALADLILLAAFTGARIEEICSIKCNEVHFSDKYIAINDAKTEAGIREVPIHPIILSKVEELVLNSKDGYLLPGLTFNKYGDRSNAIGKRFGRLKNKNKYEKQFVFHSIRKTFVTILENANVPENFTADIVGHEKPRMTYGLYSGGTALEVKRDAINKVKYVFDLIGPPSPSAN